jgi:hypothetical protein
MLTGGRVPQHSAKGVWVGKLFLTRLRFSPIPWLVRSYQQKQSDPAQASFETLLFYPEPKEQKPEEAASASPPEDPGFDSLTLPIYRVQLVREGNQPLRERPHIHQPTDAVQVFSDFLQDRDREHVRHES